MFSTLGLRSAEASPRLSLGEPSAAVAPHKGLTGLSKLDNKALRRWRINACERTSILEAEEDAVK